MTHASTGWVFWAGTVGFGVPVFDRLEAAAAVDIQRFSITPLDVEWAGNNGVGPKELGRRINASGYDIVMDPLVNWYGGDPHPGSRFGRFSADDTLRMCENVGAVSVNIIGQPEHDATLDQLVTAFAAVCDRVREIGAEATLEFTPISAIATLSQGWDIVRAADHPSGGLLFDTWHFDRSGGDLATLASVPGDRIFSVQVADARPEITDNVRADTIHRMLPGDGTIDLGAVLATLHRIGGLRWVGTEVISPELEAMDPATAARLADGRVRELLAGIEDA
ncbi:MAG: sugar phosphate isomerase/epimerase [Acidimicrobiales bacterium]